MLINTFKLQLQYRTTIFMGMHLKTIQNLQVMMQLFVLHAVQAVILLGQSAHKCLISTDNDWNGMPGLCQEPIYISMGICNFLWQSFVTGSDWEQST